ncbi:rhox homeobox family member 1-like [Acomys russatus]|uniref:rhox homeobox family member 1-like n=1 Tax=Acomys russatus TaxID=60746 RepID=UPI0021E20C37|nr:rhox homeobox family member 1-like [Acomys russatus]
MESKYFYFDLDYYGVGFYEEEIMPESQQRAAAAASRFRFGRGVRVLHELGLDDPMSSKYNHNHDYNHETKKEKQAKPKEARWGKLEGPGKAAGEVSSRPNRRRVKHLKFTKGQLCELDKVFQKTHYPNASQRKALAKLIHVDEKRVKAWFKNKRSKYKIKKDTPGTLSNAVPEMKEDPKSACVPEEPNRFILYKQHPGQFCWS